jgi:hypothetical protein
MVATQWRNWRRCFVVIHTDVRLVPSVRAAWNKGVTEMKKREQWIEDASERIYAEQLGGPIWEQAIQNVRFRQEEELRKFRDSAAQVLLELAEFEKLAKIKAEALYIWTAANERLIGLHPLRCISLDGARARQRHSQTEPSQLDVGSYTDLVGFVGRSIASLGLSGLIAQSSKCFFENWRAIPRLAKFAKKDPCSIQSGSPQRVLGNWVRSQFMQKYGAEW